MTTRYLFAGCTLAALALYYDFKAWQSAGTGGTPPTLRGYLKIRRWGLYLTLHPVDIHDVSTLPTTGPRYLDLGHLPPRPGPKPTLTRWILPQRQYDAPVLPPGTSDTLHSMMRSFAGDAAYAAYIEARPSVTEGGTGDAIFVVPGSTSSVNPLAGRIFHEVAHVHPADGSLHVYLSGGDARAVVERGWGVRFPVGWIAPVGWVMVFAPRDEGEVGVVREIVRAAVCFAVGREVGGDAA